MAMVASYHCGATSLLALRRRFPNSLRGVTLRNLISLAEELGFSVRTLRAEPVHLGKISTPAILHWDLSHFVVLRSIQGGKAVIHDPARGRRKMTLTDLSEHFTGIALEIIPTSQSTQRLKTPRLPLSTIIPSAARASRGIYALLSYSVALELLALLAPLYLQFAADRLAEQWNIHFIEMLAVVFAALALWRSAFNLLRTWTVAHFRAILTQHAGAAIFSHLIRLPLTFFDGRNMGDILSRVGSLERIQNAVSADAIATVMDGVMSVLTLALMFLYSIKLAVIGVIVATVVAIVRIWQFRALRVRTEDWLIARAAENTHLLETLRGIQTIKTYGAEAARERGWEVRLGARLESQLSRARLLGISQSLQQGLTSVGDVVVVWIGAVLVHRGSMSIGMLFAFAAYYSQFSSRANGLASEGVQLSMVKLHLERLSDILLSDKDERFAKSQAVRADLESKVSLHVNNLSYQYDPSSPMLFENLSFSLCPGNSLCIVGPSGCGKSTLIKLLLALLEPVTGEISINGIDILRLHPSVYRKYIGAVTEADQLFQGTIAENISFFSDNSDISLIRWAANLAAIDRDISSLPMGYESIIGDMGTFLSEGQKQRLLLARAIYRRPSFLLLDEPTSHLDVKTESEVMQGIEELDATRIIVAHRPETIQYADSVLDLRSWVPWN
jgi:ATP-binding cassette subfamily B protein RaxB